MNSRFKIKKMFLFAVLGLFISGCGGNGGEGERAGNPGSGLNNEATPLYATHWTATGYKDTITSAAFSPDGKTIATGADAADNILRFHNAYTGEVVNTIDTANNWNVAFTIDGNTLIGGGRDTITLWDIATGQTIRTIDGVSISLRSMALSPDGKNIVTGGLDPKCDFWDLSTGNHLKALRIKGFCWFNAFSPDGNYLATGGNSDIQVIDTRSDRVVLTLKGYIFDPMNTANNDTFAAVFTPDGRSLITGGADQVIRIWEIPSGKLVKEFVKHAAVIREMAVTPDGNTLVAGSFIDISVWDMSTGRNIKTIPGIKQTSALKISPDGKTIVSGGADRILRMWNLQN